MIVLALFQAAFAADCPANLFFSPPLKSGAPTPAPFVSAYCEGTNLVVVSNGMPGWSMPTTFRNQLTEQRHHFKIPLTPVAAPKPTEVPYLGTIAVSITGIPIYAPNEAGDLAYGDAKLDGRLDACNGHTGPNGGYHFHARPECPFSESKDLATPIIAYAFDGYPILEPWVCADGVACHSLQKIQGSWHDCVDDKCTVVAVKKLDASWTLQKPEIKAAWDKYGYVAGSGDLDQCNGKVGPDGKYAYYATDGFPYMVGCYHGVIDKTLNRMHVGWSLKGTAADTGLRRGSGGGGGGGFRDRQNRMMYFKEVSERLDLPFHDVRAVFKGIDDGDAVDLDVAAAKLGVDEPTLIAAIHGHG